MAEKTEGVTTPRQFRLREDTLADLDAIAEHLSATTGAAGTRSDAIRYAARQVAARLKKTSRKSSNNA